MALRWLLTLFMIEVERVLRGFGPEEIAAMGQLP